jgi:hypothetical protein
MAMVMVSMALRLPSTSSPAAISLEGDQRIWETSSFSAAYFAVAAERHGHAPPTLFRLRYQRQCDGHWAIRVSAAKNRTIVLQWGWRCFNVSMFIEVRDAKVEESRSAQQILSERPHSGTT